MSVPPSIPPKVFYGPHPIESMFSKLDLFSVLNDHRKAKSLSNRLSIPITIPEHNPALWEPILPLPSPQPTENLNPMSEESHTLESTELPTEPPPEQNIETTYAEPVTELIFLENTTTLPKIALEPLEFEAEYEIGPTIDEHEVCEDQEDTVPLSQIRKAKENAKGKMKVAETRTNTNLVQKIQVFPQAVSASRRRARSTTAAQKEVPSPVRKSKRKQTTPERVETDVTLDQPTTQKKRKKNTAETPLMPAILYIYSPLILVVLKVILCILVKLGIVCVLYCPSAEISTRNNKGRLLDKFWKKRELQ